MAERICQAAVSAIIIMEESAPLQVLTFFMRSNEIQELRVDVFDSCDQFITNLTLHNYNTHTIHLQHHLTHFYCILCNNQYRIEEQMEVKITQDPENLLPVDLERKFGSFALTLKIELKKPLQNAFLSDKLLQQQNQLSRFVGNHLRKLQKTVLKRMEVEELKKPLRETNKPGKNSSVRKVKSKLHLTTFTKLPSNEKRKRPQDLETTLKSLERRRHKVTDESEQSEQSVKMEDEVALKSKKHNTLFQNNPVCHTETSSKDYHQKTQKQASEGSFISQFIKALQPSEKERIKKIKRTRLAHLSHNQELAQATAKEIGNQKRALQVVKSMKGLYSQQVSPVRGQECSQSTIRKKSSPYLLLNSRAFIKRKVK